MRDAGCGIRDSEFGIRGSGFGVRDSGFGVRGSGFGFRGSEFGIRDWGDHIARRGLELRLQVHDSRILRVLRDRFGFNLTGNYFRVPGAGSSGFGFRILLRVSGSALRASGVRYQVSGAGETFSVLHAAKLASTSAIRFSSGSYTLHPSLYTTHPTPYTLHPAPCTPNPCTPNPEPRTPHPKSCPRMRTYET